MTDFNQTSVRPFLTVNDGAKAVEFYIAAFGAVETKRFERPGQKLSSVIEIDTAVFYVADEEPENGNISPGVQSNSSVRIIVETNNADQLFAQALQLGATQICAMTTEEDWRIGKLKDPFGHVWELGYKL